jgi:hypothetical protein
MGMEIGWLAFWKARPGGEKRAVKIYEALRDGRSPEELEDLPVERIVRGLKKRYPQMERHGRYAEIDVDEEEMGMEVSWDEKHFHFTFYGDAFGQMDEVVKLMGGFGLPCFDWNSRTMLPLENPPSFQGTPEEKVEMDTLFEVLKGRADASKTEDPQERLRELNAFLKWGAAKKEVDRRLGEKGAAPAKKKSKAVKAAKEGAPKRRRA